MNAELVSRDSRAKAEERDGVLTFEMLAFTGDGSVCDRPTVWKLAEFCEVIHQQLPEMLE
jgi:hypothetical protein